MSASIVGPLSSLICLSFRLHSKACRFSSESFWRLPRADRDRDSGGRISRLHFYRLFFPELRQGSDRELRSLVWRRRRPGHDRWRSPDRLFLDKIDRLRDLFPRAAGPRWVDRLRNWLAYLCLYLSVFCSRILVGMNLAVRVEAVWEQWRRIRLANPGLATRVRLEEGMRLRATDIVRWS